MPSAEKTAIYRTEATVSSVDELTSLPLSVIKATIKEDEDTMHDERVFVRHMNDYCRFEEDTKVGGFVEDSAIVGDRAYIGADCLVLNMAQVRDYARIRGGTWIYENAILYDNAQAYYGSMVFGNSFIYENALVARAWVAGQTKLHGNVRICGIAVLGDLDMSIDYEFTDEKQISRYVIRTEKLRKELDHIGKGSIKKWKEECELAVKQHEEKRLELLREQDEQPQLAAYTTDKVSAKLEFLCSKLPMQKAEILNEPRIVGYSLKRMSDRIEFLELLGEPLPATLDSLRAMLSPSDKKFLGQYEATERETSLTDLLRVEVKDLSVEKALDLLKRASAEKTE